MMFWYDHDLGVWDWFGMSVGLIVFLALIGTLCSLLHRAWARPRGGSEPAATPPDVRAPRQLLAERYARGEIGEKEYRRGRAVLDEAGGDAPGIGRH